MKRSKLQIFYIEMAIVAAIGLDYAIYLFVQQHGFDVSLFLRTLISNPVALFATIEVAVLFITFIVWMIREARQLEMKYQWLYVALCVFPSPAIGVPLFFYWREKYLREGLASRSVSRISNHSAENMTAA